MVLKIAATKTEKYFLQWLKQKISIFAETKIIFKPIIIQFYNHNDKYKTNDEP